MKRSSATVHGAMWLATFATFRRRHIFENETMVEYCVQALKECCEKNGYQVYALAVMPDHLHLIVDAGASGHDVPKILNNLKGLASRRVFQANPELKLDLKGNHLWTRGYDARRLSTDEAFHRASRYVADNPTKLGYQQQTYDWLSAPRPVL